MDTEPPPNPSALLAEMAQLAANIARAWAPVAERQARQVEQGTLDPEARDAVKTFNSVTRTLRQTLALHAKLQQPASPARTPIRPIRGHAELRRRVERTIDEQADPSERENLLADLHERLDCEDFERDFATLPLEDAIAIICHDLGLHAAHGASPPTPPIAAPNCAEHTAARGQNEPRWQTTSPNQDRARTSSGSDPPSAYSG